MSIGERVNDLKYVLDNICFGINGDIILFLSYITSNTQILAPILQSIVTHMDDWEELDLDTNNVEYLPYNEFEEKKSWYGYFKNIDREGEGKAV